MKIRIYTILCNVAILLMMTACEQELEFTGAKAGDANNLVINAIAITDSPLTVFVTHTYARNANIPPFETTVPLNGYTSYEQKGAMIFDAEVEARINGNQLIKLELAPDSMGYVCDYKPQVNDHIEINISYSGVYNSDGRTTTARAETTIPVKPQLEVLSYEKLEEGMSMRMDCQLSDPGGEQYYLMRVRGEKKATERVAYYDENGKVAYYEDYVYYPMYNRFYENESKVIHGRVFDNSKFKGQTYNFTINSTIPEGNNSSYSWWKGELEMEGVEVPPQFIVELEAISPELYKYFKSLERYRRFTDDEFSEPVQIYSNVQNGWGIFGSLSSQRIIIPYE